MVGLDEPQKTLAWSNTVSIVLTAIVSAGLTYYFMSGGGAPQVGVAGVFIDLLRYLPHSLLLFGILADMLTYEGVYSIPSLVGLLSIFVNKLLQFFWDGLYSLFMASGAAPAPPASTAPSDRACEIAGFEFAASSYVPQTLVVTATVFFYYALDLIANRGWVSATATIVLLGVLFIGQVLVLGPCNKMGLGKGLQAALAIVEGLLIGGFSLGVVTNYYPERLPSAVLPQYPRKSVKDLKPGPDGTMVDEDGIPWTVLANGAVVPDVSTEKGRAAFQTTGAPAQPSSCPS